MKITVNTVDGSKASARSLPRVGPRVGALLWPGLLGLAVALGGQAGCGDDDGSHQGCTLGTAEGCRDDEICEETRSGTPACFPPVVVSGRVFALGTDADVAGATVVAVDANGAARSRVARSAADGTYALTVPHPRGDDGEPAPGAVTLRVAADAHRPFPEGVRVALPLDLTTAIRDDGRGPWRLANAATDVALIAVANGPSGRIEGHVEASAPGGVLVVAERDGRAVASALSDTGGHFVLFNLPAGSLTVQGRRQGLWTEARTVAVEADETLDLVLPARTDGLGTVRGSVSIVNAPGGSRTSVILALASTYDAATRRAESPTGLRATEVSGAWSLEGVPPGDYVVLAAFENDRLVRDPDESIGGTATVLLTVPADLPADEAVSVPGFKVTEALALTGPGATGFEVVDSATPTLSWADDSSEDGYELRVFDALGTEVFSDLAVPRVTGSADVTYALTAPLAPGIYQYRVLSHRDGQGGGARTYISASEDLLGVFEVHGD